MSLGHEHGLVLIGLAGLMDVKNLSLSLSLSLSSATWMALLSYPPISVQIGCACWDALNTASARALMNEQRSTPVMSATSIDLLHRTAAVVMISQAISMPQIADFIWRPSVSIFFTHMYGWHPDCMHQNGSLQYISQCTQLCLAAPSGCCPHLSAVLTILLISFIAAGCILHQCRSQGCNDEVANKVRHAQAALSSRWCMQDDPDGSVYIAHLPCDEPIKAFRCKTAVGRMWRWCKHNVGFRCFCKWDAGCCLKNESRSHFMLCFANNVVIYIQCALDDDIEQQALMFLSTRAMPKCIACCSAMEQHKTFLSILRETNGG